MAQFRHEFYLECTTIKARYEMTRAINPVGSDGRFNVVAAFDIQIAKAEAAVASAEGQLREAQERLALLQALRVGVAAANPVAA